MYLRIENTLHYQTYLFKSCSELAWLGYVLQVSLNSTECQKYYLDNCRRLKRTNTNFGTCEIKMKASGVVSHFTFYNKTFYYRYNTVPWRLILWILSSQTLWPQILKALDLRISKKHIIWPCPVMPLFKKFQ